MPSWKHRLFFVVLTFLLGNDGEASDDPNHPPLALHHLYEVPNNGNGNGNDVVISLRGHDLDGDETTATITKLPEHGSLFQLSRIFDTHGYDPKAGIPITDVPALVTGKDSRVVYRRGIDWNQIGRQDGRNADEFEYTVNDGINDGGTDNSLAGTITLVSDETRRLVSSEFRFDDEGWTTTGNAASSNKVRHEASQRGENMSN